MQDAIGLVDVGPVVFRQVETPSRLEPAARALASHHVPPRFLGFNEQPRATAPFVRMFELAREVVDLERAAALGLLELRGRLLVVVVAQGNLVGRDRLLAFESKHNVLVLPGARLRRHPHARLPHAGLHLGRRVGERQDVLVF